MTMDRIRQALNNHGVEYIDNIDSVDAVACWHPATNMPCYERISVDSDGMTTINGQRCSLYTWLGY
jgi:hypothetical protein